MPQNNKKQMIGDCCALILLLFPIIYVIDFLSSASFDPDTFFLITTGRNIVETGSVPTVNPFVIHEGLEMIVQQWLFDVIMYYLYTWFGQYGIYIYTIIAAAIAGIIIYKIIGLYTKNRDVKFFCIALFYVSMYPFFVARPTSISLSFCALIVLIMEQYRMDRNWKRLLLLPVISIAVVNLHAAMWPILFVLMLPYLAPEEMLDFIKSLFAISKDNQKIKFDTRAYLQKNKVLFLFIAIMVVVGFINPNGWKSMFYSALSYNSATNGNIIQELQPPTIISTFGAMCVGTIIVFAIYVIFFKDKLNIPLIYMSLGTIFLAFSHYRNGWFLSFSLLPLITILLNAIISKNSKTDRKQSKIQKWLLLCFGLIIMATPFIIQPQELEDSITSPVEAREYLDTMNKDEIVLYTGFNNGAYMEFYGYTVYIDARPELYQSTINKKEDIYQEYIDINHSGAGDITAFLNKYNFTHLIAGKGHLLDAYLQASDQYVAVVDTESYRLYEIVQ